MSSDQENVKNLILDEFLKKSRINSRLKKSHLEHSTRKINNFLPQKPYFLWDVNLLFFLLF